MTSRIMLVLLFSTNILLAEEKQPAGTEVKTGGVYLRIASIQALGASSLDLKLADKPFVSGIQPGYFQDYTVLPKCRELSFTLIKNNIQVASFKVTGKKEPGFYTFLIHGGRDVLETRLLADHNHWNRQTGECTKRLRVFIGAFGFPVTVDAGAVGLWTATDKAVIGEKAVTDEFMPGTIVLVYTNAAHEEIRCRYPLLPGPEGSSSIFVTQRGPLRPRIRAYPDCRISSSENPE